MISIIIPTFNEAATIEKLVHYLQQHCNGIAIEIIVADAGSTDDTLTLARAAGAHAQLSPQKGRAAQMNFGASLATGDIHYFVHADTIPPPTYALDIEAAVKKGFDCGRYQTKFDSRSRLLKVNAFFTRFDWFICYGGDQTFFITRQLFDTLGGFNSEMQIMEEFEFTTRARKQGRYKIFNAKTLVSARKYEGRSWWQVQMANKKAVALYKKGASQATIVETYKQMLQKTSDS
jgi:rSAM/selenodomain-associated transferase 2